MVPARPVADGRGEIGPCRQGPERVHSPEARRPDHPSAGGEAVHRAAALGEVQLLDNVTGSAQMQKCWLNFRFILCLTLRDVLF